MHLRIERHFLRRALRLHARTIAFTRRISVTVAIIGTSNHAAMGGCADDGADLGADERVDF